MISVVVLTILASSASGHGSTLIKLLDVSGFNWNSFVAGLMADLFKYCFLLLRLSNKFVLRAIFVSTNSYGMTQLVSLPFKAFEMKPLLELLDLIVGCLASGFDFFDLL